MALVIDSQEAGGVAHQGATSPLTWSFNNVSGTLLLVGVHVSDGGGSATNGTATGVTFNGVALTKIPSASISWNGTTDEASLWYLLNPATGSHTLSVTWTATGTSPSCLAANITFTGNDSTTPVGTPASAKNDTGSGSTSASVTVNSTTSGNYVVAVCGAGNTYTGTSNTQSALLNIGSGNGGGNIMLTDQAVSTSSTTMTNALNQDYWGIVAVEVKAGVAAGATQKARPSADVTDGNWLNEVGSNVNLYASIDEVDAPVDTDYIQSGANPQGDAVKYALSSVVDPLVNTGHTLRYRVRLDQVVGGTISLLTELRQSSGALSTPASFTDVVSTATEATLSQALSAAQADAIVNYADLQMWHTATQNAGAAPTFVAAGTAVFTATNAATFMPGLPAGTNGQDILLLVLERGDNTAATAITGWTQIAGLSGNNGTTHRVETWWIVAAGSAGSATTTTAPAITMGSSTVVRGGRMFAFRGADTTTPFPNSSLLNNASGNTCATTNISPTVANTLGVFIGTAMGQRTAATTPTGWAAPVVANTTLGSDMTIMHTTKTFSTTGSYGAPSTTWTSTTTGVTEGLLIAVQPTVNNSKARVTWVEFEVPAAGDPFPIAYRPWISWSWVRPILARFSLLQPLKGAYSYATRSRRPCEVQRVSAGPDGAHRLGSGGAVSRTLAGSLQLGTR